MSGPRTVAPANVARDVALVAAALARGDEVAHRRHRQGHQPAGGEALDAAHNDELREVLGGAAQRRGDDERRQRDLQQPLAAVAVAELAPQRRRGRRGDDVRRDDPRDVGEAARGRRRSSAARWPGSSGRAPRGASPARRGEGQAHRGRRATRGRSWDQQVVMIGLLGPGPRRAGGRAARLGTFDILTVRVLASSTAPRQQPIGLTLTAAARAREPRVRRHPRRGGRVAARLARAPRAQGPATRDPAPASPRRSGSRAPPHPPP